jgi:hypothetical protein
MHGQFNNFDPEYRDVMENLVNDHPSPLELQVQTSRVYAEIATNEYTPLVAVGTVVTHCPPHGPVLARLTHTVLTLDVWRRNAHWDRGAECGLPVSGQPRTS